MIRAEQEANDGDPLLCIIVLIGLGVLGVLWLCRLLRWQALGYFVELVGESSAISLGMSGDLGKSV